MRDESGQQPPALTTRRIALGNGELIVNPDSWRKIRKTTANVYLGSMLSYSSLAYPSVPPLVPSRAATGVVETSGNLVARRRRLRAFAGSRRDRKTRSIVSSPGYPPW